MDAEQLERRFALAAVPTATVSGPSVAGLIGQEIPLTVTFDNTSTNPADVGYSPFVDIVMPATGDAPPTPNDGISFKPNSATYNGLSLTTTVLTFDAAGKATHPFAKNPDGTPLIVSGKARDQLVVVQLPFGSYGPDQPAAAINFTGVVSPLAQPNHTYNVTATGGFQYQADGSGNPTINVATLGGTDTDPVAPQLFRLTKTSSAAEGETATGPNFTHSYTVSMAVAPGQTVTDLLLEDILPDNVQFVSVTSVTGNGATTITPVDTPSTSMPGGTLSRRFDKVVGTGSDTDAVLTFRYYVPEKDASGNDVIPLGTGGTATAINSATAEGSWTSANPNYPNPQTVSGGPAMHTLTAKTTALQKTVADLTHPGSSRAGDTLEYTLTFQVSDYFALSNFNLADVLTDGQEFDATFTPTITFTQKSQTLTGTFAPGNFSAVVQANGSTNVDFNVSAQVDALGLVTDGTLIGAGIPNTGTGSPTTLPNPTPGGPGTTGTITFRTKILDTYRQTPRPGAAVVQGDVISDTATTDATVLDYATLAPTASTVADTSSASVTLVSGNVAKSIYAVNGKTVSGTPTVTAGDAVTFRVTYNLPFSSIKDYSITDFLPLPIFAAQGLTFAGGGSTAAAPASGQWKWGPTDTYHTISGITPSLSFSSAANSETWSFGTFQDSQDRSATTDILFTVSATNRPFADGLLLTNQAEQQERNETGDVLKSNTALAQVKISEPLLDVTKGVVSTNDPFGIFNPKQVAPAGVTFSQPGIAGASFTGTVTSTGLASQPIDATLSNVVGNDLVKFCIIVENTGSGPNGAYDVTFKDTFDATKMQIPTNATGLNLRITDGTGATLPYTSLGGAGSGLFGSGIRLNDPGATVTPGGALDPGKTTAGTVIDNGRNIAVITYDMQLLPSVAPADVILNTATVTNYASTEGGPNFTPPAGLSDSTTVTVVSPSAGKRLVDTSIVDANNTLTQAVIGERATFELTIKVPQGTTPGAVVVDTLPAGLAFVQMVGAPVVDPGVTVNGSSSTSNPAFTPVVTNNGQTLTFNLGDIVNTNTDRQLYGFTLRYQTVVLNVSSNVINKTLTNSAKLTWTGHTELPAALSATPVTVIEPKLKVDKTVDKATAQAGDTVTFTIVLSHTSQSQTDAYNVDLSDVIPAGLTYVAGSLQNTAGVAPTTLTPPSGGSTFTAAYAKLAKGQTSTLTFQAKLDADVIAGKALVNTATETWTSLSGSPGQITPNNPNAYERTGSGSTSLGQLNNYKASDPATVTVAQPSVTKALVTTSIDNASNSKTQAVIGETATYTVTMKIPQGRTPAAKLIDTLPAGMAYVQTISAVNDDPTFLTVPGLFNAPTLGTGGQTFTYDLGDIVNTDTDSATDETITFTVQAVVLNVTSNVSGTSLVNKAKTTWNSGANFTADVSSGAVTVIEPKLLVQKTKAVGGLGGNVGDPVTYTITITNDGSPATDAYNATLSDVIPAEISGVVIDSVTDPTSNATPANFSLAGNTITTTTPFTVPKSNTVTIVVKGTLAGPVSAGQQIVNTAFGEWTSLPGDPGQITPNNANAYERTGSGSTSLGQLNNYHASGVATITPNSVDLAVVKTVSNASPNVGDTITFTVTVTNNGPNTAHNASITDTFPSSPELTFLSASAAAGTTFTPGGVGGIWTVPSISPGQTKVLTLTARVNAPATAGAIPATLTNTATVTGVDEPDSNPSNNTGTATETPKYADLGVKKTTSNVTPNVGDTITYTVSLFNLGTSTATNVEVTDTLPGNVSYVSASAAAGTMFTPGGVGGIWTVPSIAPGQTKLLTITVRATASGTSFNTVTITDSDVYDPNRKNDTAKTPTSPLEADLVVSKTVDNARPQVGDNVTFTVTLENLGPSSAAGVVVADPLPAGLELVSATPSAGSYDAGTGDWTLGTVAANTTSTLTIVAKVLAPSSGAALPQTNTATAKSTTPDPNPDNNTDTSTETPLQADLAVFKTVSDPTPNVGDTITFAIGVANYGPDTATNVVVNDLLPAGVTFVSATASVGTYVAGTGVWTVGTVTTSDFPTLLITATVDRPSSGTPAAVTNTATVSGTEYDPDPDNNTDSVTETPQYADLAIDKQVSDATPNVGDIITFTIMLSNLGADTATGVTVLDQLPAGLEFVSALPSQGTYTVGTGIWDVGTVDTSFPRTLSIQARVPTPTSGIPQPQTNTARVRTSDQYDPDPSNNEDSVTETPKYADLDVEKTVDVPRPNVGDTITFTITLSNLGKDTATGVTLGDLLPAGLAFLSANPAQGSYDPVTGEWDVGSLAASGVTTLTIDAEVVSGVAQTNVATVTKANEYDPNKTNNTSSVTETPLVAELSIRKSVVSPTPVIGDTVTYTIVVRNDGPDPAVNTIATEVFPGIGLAGITAGTPTQGSYDATTGFWDIGDLAAGAEVTITFTAKTTLLGSFTNTATVSTATYESNYANNSSEATITVQQLGVILGTDIGCTSTPLVRVIDPTTGAVRTQFYAYEPTFRGGAHVFGYDVTGDGIAEIITAPGPGRPGEVRVFTRDGVPLPQYNFFPFGRTYTNGVEIAAGPVTGAANTDLVAGQQKGGNLVRVFPVTPGTGISSTPSRQMQPFGPAFRGGVTLATADIGTFTGPRLTAAGPDGITEIIVGSGPGMRAQVKTYNGVPNPPALVNTVTPISRTYANGVSVAALPGAPGVADKYMVSAGVNGGSKVETYSGIGKIPAASFSAFSGAAGKRPDVWTAALDESQIFSVQGQFGKTNGVKKNTAPSGGTSSTLPGSTSLAPPLRVGVLRSRTPPPV